MSRRRCYPFGSHARSALIGAIFSGAFIANMMAPAAAGIAIRGQADNVQLEVENASIREVLDALATAFKFKYKLPSTIGRELTGRYSGTLRQVLARILDGNDYVMHVAETSTELVVLGASGAAGFAVAGTMTTGTERTLAPSASNPTAVASNPIGHSEQAPVLPSMVAPPPLASYLAVNAATR
jgi:hypothetical protein